MRARCQPAHIDLVEAGGGRVELSVAGCPYTVPSRLPDPRRLVVPTRPVVVRAASRTPWRPPRLGSPQLHHPPCNERAASPAITAERFSALYVPCPTSTSPHPAGMQHDPPEHHADRASRCNRRDVTIRANARRTPANPRRTSTSLKTSGKRAPPPVTAKKASSAHACGVA